MHEKNPRVSAITLEHAREMRSKLTPAELSLWLRLRNRQVGGYKFRRQHPIGAFVVDFYCSEKHLAIEIDGDSHEEQAAYDQKRTAILKKYRCRVIRFTNQQVHDDIETVLGEIQDVLSG